MKIENLNPDLFYYLGLYLLIFLLRYIKLIKQKKSIEETISFRRILFVSLDLSYTAAGFVILLLANLKAWIPVIVIFYILYVFAGLMLDLMDDKLKAQTKLIWHVTLISLLLIMTIVTFTVILEPTSPKETMPQKREYKVLVPYKDQTLITHLGFRTAGSTKLVFLVNVEATTEEEARIKAKNEFLQKIDELPLIQSLKVKDASASIEIDDANIAVLKPQ